MAVAANSLGIAVAVWFLATLPTFHPIIPIWVLVLVGMLVLIAIVGMSWYVDWGIAVIRSIHAKHELGGTK